MTKDTDTPEDLERYAMQIRKSLENTSAPEGFADEGIALYTEVAVRMRRGGFATFGEWMRAK